MSDGSSAAGRSAWTDVQLAFQHHVEHHATSGGGENALVGLKAEGAVTLQYAGRVVYELFQNALDRASGIVRVTLTDDALIVGNDGRAFSVDLEFDYASPKRGEERSDFNAMCALHTSNKSPEGQFGNKGNGFRSVFGVSPSVQVWSRCADGGWWGLELSMRLAEPSGVFDTSAKASRVAHRTYGSFSLDASSRSRVRWMSTALAAGPSWVSSLKVRLSTSRNSSGRSSRENRRRWLSWGNSGSSQTDYV